MNGNRIGKWIGVSGFGESHGKVIGVLLEDIKPGVEFPLMEIERELARRRPGDKAFGSGRLETDKIEVLSGVIDGLTTGMPICIIVKNRDHRSGDYTELREIFRPGHADWSWYAKFKILDWRGGGRASGRETIARVAAGAVLKEILGSIEIDVYPVQIGKVGLKSRQAGYENDLNWGDPESYSQVKEELQKAQSAGDSLGGIVEVEIRGVPAGLGDPVFGKLESRLAEALMSIGSVKGIEIGEGFVLGGMRGSESNDEMCRGGFITNKCGGILGGVSTGEPIKLRLAVKPPSSIGIRQKTIDHEGREVEIEIKGRHDVTIVGRILPVVKAMVRLVLADCLSYQKLLKGKERSLVDMREAIDRIDEDILMGLKRRQEMIRAIGQLKKNQGIKVKDTARESELMAKLKTKSKAWGLEIGLVSRIWQEIIKASCKEQNK